MQITGGTSASWVVSTSNGHNAWSGFDVWWQQPQTDDLECFIRDVTGDGKADAITFDKTSETWYIATNLGTSFDPNTKKVSGNNFNCKNSTMRLVSKTGSLVCISFTDSEVIIGRANGSNVTLETQIQQILIPPLAKTPYERYRV